MKKGWFTAADDDYFDNEINENFFPDFEETEGEITHFHLMKFFNKSGWHPKSETIGDQYCITITVPIKNFFVDAECNHAYPFVVIGDFAPPYTGYKIVSVLPIPAPMKTFEDSIWSIVERMAQNAFDGEKDYIISPKYTDENMEIGVGYVLRRHPLNQHDATFIEDLTKDVESIIKILQKQALLAHLYVEFLDKKIGQQVITPCDIGAVDNQIQQVWPSPQKSSLESYLKSRERKNPKRIMSKEAFAKEILAQELTLKVKENYYLFTELGIEINLENHLFLLEILLFISEKILENEHTIGDVQVISNTTIDSLVDLMTFVPMDTKDRMKTMLATSYREFRNSLNKTCGYLGSEHSLENLTNGCLQFCQIKKDKNSFAHVLTILASFFIEQAPYLVNDIIDIV